MDESPLTEPERSGKMPYALIESAYLGSLNFTEYGMNTNTESCLTFRNPEVVNELLRYFNSLFVTDSYDSSKWGLAELGEKIYAGFLRRMKE
ncbi:MAG: phospholipase D family protein [Spirochaetaceae bacterium]|nr:phospholipase D family protein [Spirochaetaceae bacterium]